ncbi:MAG: hypothetical protein CMO81_12180 [Waddliaceae bacterium]|nr:hypothetical protein [Waddliaceae bacterium]
MAKPPKAPSNSPSGNRLVNDRVVSASTDQYLNEQDKQFLISISSESPFIPQLSKERLEKQTKFSIKDLTSLIEQLMADPAIAEEIRSYLESTGYSVPGFLTHILNKKYPNGKIPEELIDLVEKLASGQSLDSEGEEEAPSSMTEQFNTLDAETQSDVISMALFFSAIAAVTALISNLQNDMLMATADILAEYRDVSWDNLEISEDRSEKQVEKLQDQMEALKEAEKKSGGIFAGILSALVVVAAIMLVLVVIAAVVVVGAVAAIVSGGALVPLLIFAVAAIIALGASLISFAMSAASAISFAASEKTIEQQFWEMLPFEVPKWAQILIEVLVQIVLVVASLGTVLVALPAKIAEASAKIGVQTLNAIVRAIIMIIVEAVKAIKKSVLFAVTALVAATGTIVASTVVKGVGAGIKAAMVIIKTVTEAIVEALIQGTKAVLKMLAKLLVALYTSLFKGTVKNFQANIKFIKILFGVYKESAKSSIAARGLLGAIGKGASSAVKGAGSSVKSAVTTAGESLEAAKNFLKSSDAMITAAKSKANAAKESLWSKLFTETAEGTLKVNQETQKQLAAASVATSIMYSTTSLTANDRLQEAIIQVGVAFGVPEEIMDMLAQQIIAMIQILALFAAMFTLAGAGVSIQVMYKSVLVFQSATQGMSSIFQGVSLIKQGQAQEKIGEEQREAERYKGLVLQTKILKKDFQVGIDRMQETYDQLATDFKSWGDTLEHMFNAYKSALNNMTMRA